MMWIRSHLTLRVRPWRTTHWQSAARFVSRCSYFAQEALSALWCQGEGVAGGPAMMGSTIAEPARSERLVVRSVRWRHATFTLQNRVEEAYLRDDVSTGFGTTLSNASPYICIPDAETLQAFLEVFELSDVQHVVFARSVLEDVYDRVGNNHRKKGRLRALYRDTRRSSACFDDVHCRELLPSVQALSGKRSGAELLPHLVAVAELYSSRCGSATPVVVASDALAAQLGLASSPEEVARAVAGTGADAGQEVAATLERAEGTGACMRVGGAGRGVWVASAVGFFALACGGSRAVGELAESVWRGRQRDKEDEAAGASSAVWTEARVRVALSEGELVRGVFRASARDPSTGVVKASEGAKTSLADILIEGRACAGQALDGDVVAVEIAEGGGEREEDSGDAREDEDGVAVTEGLTMPEEGGADDEVGDQLVRGAASQLRGRVVAVLQRSGRDIVASLGREEEEGLLGGGGGDDRLRWMLCTPFDRRLPKVRIQTPQVSRLSGQRFVIRVDAWEPGSRYPQGHLVRVLGRIMDLKAEAEAVLVSNNIRWQPFCEAALRELPRVPPEEVAEVDTGTGGPKGRIVDWAPEAEVRRRRDLRGPEYLVCSIDPIGCTDVDDALHARALGPGQPDGAAFEVGVHIADVSHFVKPGSALDGEAASRCTSVYLSDRRLDMLPGVLSGNLCSLLSNVDRLAASVVWRLDRDLEPVAVWFGRTIIRSRYKLHYQQAQDVLDGSLEPTPAPGTDTVPREELPRLRESLEILARLSSKLRARRVADGALELASAEMRFELHGPDRLPNEVTTKREIPMMGVVAEMMILANCWVARRIHAAFPTCALLRRHAPPRDSALAAVRDALGPLGADLDGSTNAALQRSLDEACARLGGDGAPAAVLVRALATRAMSEAQYCSTGDAAAAEAGGFGHFGLALSHYTHFTSPIRRYADVVAHRQLMRAVGQDDASPRWVAAAEAGHVLCPRDANAGAGPSAGAKPAPPPPVLGHADLSAAADAMNARHREAKRASKECADLFLLALLHERPLTEPAVVVSLRERGVVVFVPRFHIRATVTLRRRDGQVVGPENAAGDAPPAGLALRGSPAEGRLAVVDEAVGRVWTFTPLQHVWVRLSTRADRAHGPTLQTALLDDTHPDVRAALSERPGAANEAPLARVDFRKLYREEQARKQAAEERDGEGAAGAAWLEAAGEDFHQSAWAATLDLARGEWQGGAGAGAAGSRAGDRGRRVGVKDCLAGEEVPAPGFPERLWDGGTVSAGVLRFGRPIPGETKSGARSLHASPMKAPAPGMGGAGPPGVAPGRVPGLGAPVVVAEGEEEEDAASVPQSEQWNARPAVAGRYPPWSEAGRGARRGGNGAWQGAVVEARVEEDVVTGLAGLRIHSGRALGRLLTGTTATGPRRARREERLDRALGELMGADGVAATG